MHFLREKQQDAPTVDFFGGSSYTGGRLTAADCSVKGEEFAALQAAYCAPCGSLEWDGSGGD